MNRALLVLVCALAAAPAGAQAIRPNTVGLTSSTGDLIYLRLDAANDPVTGQLQLDAGLLVNNGTAAAPSLAFTNSATTGFFRSSADVIGIAIAGAAKLTLSATALVPSTTGVFSLGSDALSFLRGDIDLVVAGDGAAATPSIVFDGAETSGLFRSGTSGIGLSVAGAAELLLDATNLTPAVSAGNSLGSDALPFSRADANTVVADDGTAAVPTLVFDTNETTGFSAPSNVLTASTSAVERAHMSSTETVFNDTGAATDFRVESDTFPDMIHVIGASDTIGINQATPRATVHITSADATASSTLIERVSSTTSGNITALRVEGTSTGDMADGFGPLIALNIRDAGGATDNPIAQIRATRRGGSDTTGELQLVTALAGTLSSRMKLNELGVQIDASSSAPAATDCDATSELGRIEIYTKSSVTTSMCTCLKIASAFVWVANAGGDCT